MSSAINKGAAVEKIFLGHLKGQSTNFTHADKAALLAVGVEFKRCRTLFLCEGFYRRQFTFQSHRGKLASSVLSHPT